MTIIEDHYNQLSNPFWGAAFLYRAEQRLQDVSYYTRAEYQDLLLTICGLGYV